MKINVIVSGLDPAAMLSQYGGNFAQRYVVESEHTSGLCAEKA
jgi:hypothetical protein